MSHYLSSCHQSRYPFPAGRQVGSTFLEKATLELVNLTTFYHWLGVPWEKSRNILVGRFFESLEAKHWSPCNHYKVLRNTDLKRERCIAKRSLGRLQHFSTSFPRDRMENSSSARSRNHFTHLYTSLNVCLQQRLFRNKRRSLTPKKGMFRNSNKFFHDVSRDGYRIFHCQSLHVSFHSKKHVPIV